MNVCPLKVELHNYNKTESWQKFRNSFEIAALTVNFTKAVQEETAGRKERERAQ